MQIHLLQECLNRFKVISIFVILSIVFTAKANSFDIFGRDERPDDSHYKKIKNLGEAEEAYIRGDYDKTLDICKKTEGIYKGKSGIDTVYYLEGLSYLKLKNSGLARESFNKIISDNPKSEYAGLAELGIADAYLVDDKFEMAKEIYKIIVSNASYKSLHSAALYRLYQIAKKSSNTDVANDYKARIIKEFPMSFEAQTFNEINIANDGISVIQVGSFSKKSNASKLVSKLQKKGYNASLSETKKDNSTYFRVIVKPANENVLNKTVRSLRADGYPTKIFP